MRVPLIIIILIKSNYNSNYSNNKVIIIIIIIITNNYNNNKSEEDLCTTVSIVLSANSGTFSPVFVKSLLLTSAVMGYILCRLNDCESSSSLLLSRGRGEFETGLFIQCVMLPVITG